MKPRLDDLTALVKHAGLDPSNLSVEDVVELIHAEARGRAGRAMAAVKLGKPPMLVTRAEAEAALADWTTPGDEALTGKTMRAGESALISALAERGLYDRNLANLRHTTNRALDLGETRVMAKQAPTNKRQAGRPGAREDFVKWVAVLVWFTIGSGEASSVERAVALLTGRDRRGKAVGAGLPRLALPNSKRSHWFIHDMLRCAAENLPDLIEDARKQGEISTTGGELDKTFRKELADIRVILADRDKVERCLRAIKR